MSQRDEYQPGVPCWVDVLVPDTARAMDFYGRLLGWEFDGPGQGEYYEARLRGRHVAGVGAAQPGVPTVWNTYVSVASVSAAVDAAVRAGGRVRVEPFDALPAGRVAVIEDVSGAALGLWEPAGRRGCQLVNEPAAWAMSMLHTPNAVESRRFYAEAFGWGTEEFAPGIDLFRLPGYVGGEPAQPVPRDVVAVMTAEDGPAYWSVDFWVRDADSLAGDVTALGGQVIAPPFDDPGGMRHAVLSDPFDAAFMVTEAPGH